MWAGRRTTRHHKNVTPQEVLQEKHRQVRGSFTKIDHPAYGVVTLPVTGKMSKTPLRIKWSSAAIGEDNDYVFKKYGLVTITTE
jgi:crotonobetainyl-CoA:carnitine CoA-transferase CaiB-like acyl-CoA transferase